MRKQLMIGLTAAALTLGGLGTAVASGKFGHGPEGMMGGRMLDRMAEKLDLTTEQQSQAEDIIIGSFKEMRENKRAMKDLRTELRQLDPSAADYAQKSEKLAADIAAATEKMVLMRSEQRQAFNAILTDEQRTELAQLKDDWKEHGRGEGKRGKQCRH